MYSIFATILLPSFEISKVRFVLSMIMGSNGKALGLRKTLWISYGELITYNEEPKILIVKIDNWHLDLSYAHCQCLISWCSKFDIERKSHCTSCKNSCRTLELLID
jgi:hypothetical protein